MASQNTYQPIARGASLLLAFSLPLKTVLIIGGGNLAATRAFVALQADARVVVWVEGGLGSVCDELACRASQQELEVRDLDRDPNLDTFLSEAGTQVSFAFITDTLMGTTGKKRSTQSLMRLRENFRRHRIPTNVADMPAFCDFTVPATHRFSHSKTLEPTSLQLAVTTNGRGCRLATRIRRDIVSKLPTTVADAVETISRLRSHAKALDEERLNSSCAVGAECDDCLPSTPNKPVPQLPVDSESTAEETSKRRMRWIAQISEFWPLDKLGSLTPEEQNEIIAERPSPVDISNTAPLFPLPSRHSLDIRPQPLGRILLLGSGPGHPSLLTLAAYHTLTKQATFVLSDKLVPAPVLALIPSHVPVKIARKFPGNADGAQNELMVEAVEAARRGEVVVRLKQGDPGIFGRVGEEILYFRAHGFEATVVPGVSSALAGPTFSNISLTQRGVAESFIVCTGVGRQGKAVSLPGYARNRTMVLLMGVARLSGIIDGLVQKDVEDGKGRRDGAAYPPHLPIAIIESASMPDQRIITGTLESIQAAMDSIGEQRPPGMIVVGWAVLALWREGEITVLDDDESLNSETRDVQRVEKWLNGRSWRVQEGLSKEWAGLADALMPQ